MQKQKEPQLQPTQESHWLDAYGTMTRRAFPQSQPEMQYEDLLNSLVEQNPSFLSFSEWLLEYEKAMGESVACFSTLCGLSRSSVSQWRSGKKDPRFGKNAREVMYQICFGLGYDAVQTKHFFERVYFDRAFACRLKKEAVYRYCLTHRKPGGDKYCYRDALALFACIQSEPHCDKAIAKSTVNIIREIDNLQSEADLQEYLTSPYFLGDNHAAMEYLQDMEQKIRSITGNHRKDILSLVYGVGINMAEESLNAHYPRMLSYQLPRRSTKKELSYTGIRKLLILEAFYVFFSNSAKAGIPTAEAETQLRIFIDDMNDLLNNVGYGSLYPRNPFDWLILHCIYVPGPSGRRHPIETFRSILTSASD